MAFLKQIEGVWIDMDTNEPAEPQPEGKEPWLTYIDTGPRNPLPEDDAYVMDDDWYRSCATLEEFYGEVL